MAGARGEQALGVRLEKMDGVERTGAQGRLVLLHAAVGDARQGVGIDSGAADVVGQANPWRRHLGDRGEAQAFQVSEAEVGARRGADDEERITSHDVAEADEIGLGLAIARHHHRSGPPR